MKESIWNMMSEKAVSLAMIYDLKVISSEKKEDHKRPTPGKLGI